MPSPSWPTLPPGPLTISQEPRREWPGTAVGCAPLGGNRAAVPFVGLIAAWLSAAAWQVANTEQLRKFKVGRLCRGEFEIRSPLPGNLTPSAGVAYRPIC